ncbi:hypothetical protein SAMN04489713_104270 [Actinomadura madurae]|uniref:Uncharacterized protein n=1 Tax=Actinomadura madurae TaxID=1993 RepID=A0A1I5ESW9_9ACTN|nr:hypothetical protein [Actinomadura madurae]SFO14625.1 hypothetical protein SAMN04489713_104270 [Actinomadura madurae]
MTTNPYYKLINGEPMISPAGLALLLDLPVEEVLAEYERQGKGAASGVLRMPAEWRRRGVRVRKETQAALGYEAGMKECIDYLASKP